MQKKFYQSISSGVLATFVMTLVMMASVYMGMPKMSPPSMLSEMMKLPLSIGWVMHFVIGIIFAVGYVYVFNRILHKVSNVYLKGGMYGIIIFIFAQIGFSVLDMIFGSNNATTPEGSMILMMVGSILGHIIFGIVVAFFVKKSTPKFSPLN